MLKLLTLVCGGTLQPLKITRKYLKPEEVEALVAQVTPQIQSNLAPAEVFLVGSAATGKMTDQSDLDFVVIMEDEQSLNAARKKLGSIRSPSQIGLDIILVTESEFDRKKQIGGICMVAATEGLRIMEKAK